MKKQILIILFIFPITTLFGQSMTDITSGFYKLPYLIYEGSNTEMKIIWQLDVTNTCELHWGTDNTYSLGSALTTEYGDDHQHGHTITNLSPGTKYYYKVISPGGTHEATFRSAPSETETILNFFMYGDTRTQYSWHDAVSAAIISDYQADSSFQTLTVCTGDLVTYGAVESEWQTEFFTDQGPNIQQRLSEVPFVSCLGNHGLYMVNYSGLDTNSVLFGKYFPYPYVDRRYWSFDYGPVHFTIADLYPGNYDPYAQGLLDDDQLAWIENDLNTTTKDWKFVIIHEPGWSAGGSSSGAPHPNNENVQDLLQPLLEQYGVQMLQCGHNHYYAHAVKNGVLHLTAAGGGAPLYSPDPGYSNVMKTSETHHYCKAEISGDNMLITVLTPYGDTVDIISLMQNSLPSHLLGFLSKEAGSGAIEEVQIEINGNIIHPDQIGYYGLELDAGVYDVTFTLPGYKTISDQVEIISGTETQLDTMMVIASGIMDTSSKAIHISIFPNPASDKITLTNDGVRLIKEVRIYDQTGQRVLHEKEGVDVIDISSIASGIYILEARMEEGVVREKFVKR